MKGYLALLILTLFLISGCGNQPVSTCGDNVCDITESCECQDCKTIERCQTSIIQKPKDCGDGRCVDGERCDLTKYETVCPEDCNYDCPAKTKVSNFECGNNCQENSPSHFMTTSGTSSIKANLENSGELITDTITPKFICYKDGSKIAYYDDGLYKGVKFKDYFNSNEETTTISSRVSKAGNKATYYLTFDTSKIEMVFEAECIISFYEASVGNPTQTVYISFS